MFLKILVFVVGLQLAASQTYDKVNLTFVYESRCPFSLQFLSSQFYKGYKTLPDYIDIELVLRTWPYDNGTLTCQHGENECFISKAQACVYDRPGVTQQLKVEYFYCTEAQALKGLDVVDSDIEACVNSVLTGLVTYDTVKTCMNSDESFNLLKVHYDTENRYGVDFVPWLAFFGQYDEDNEKQLRLDFIGTICKMLSNPPSVCNQ